MEPEITEQILEYIDRILDVEIPKGLGDKVLFKVRVQRDLFADSLEGIIYGEDTGGGCKMRPVSDGVHPEQAVHRRGGLT